MTVSRTLGVLAAALTCAAVAAAPAAAGRKHFDIVGGSAAPAGSWPSIAYLEGGYHDGQGRDHAFACTGSVVAPQWIVTAAHCTFGEGSKPPERMVATLGVTDAGDPAGERIAVDRFVPDPSYDRDRLVGDIGLLHLARPTSRPAAPLATSAAAAANRYFSPPGVPNAAGWGAVDAKGTQLPTQLQQAYLQVHTSAECSSQVSGFDPGTQTCAGTQGAARACLGDSGGPLVEMDPSSGQPVLWGVTSYGPETPSDQAPCRVDLPAVYTWIPAYGGFIQNTITGSATAAGSPPAPAPSHRGAAGLSARSVACRKARAAVTTARRHERLALLRLRAARRGQGDALARRRSTLTVATRGYREAQVLRRRAVANATRRCPA